VTPALTCGKLYFVMQTVNIHSMSRLYFGLDTLCFMSVIYNALYRHSIFHTNVFHSLKMKVTIAQDHYSLLMYSQG
jgi:hypothetical protein